MISHLELLQSSWARCGAQSVSEMKHPLQKFNKHNINDNSSCNNKYVVDGVTSNEDGHTIAFELQSTSHHVLTDITVSLIVIAADLIQP